jgi:hypothetical protein
MYRVPAVGHVIVMMLSSVPVTGRVITTIHRAVEGHVIVSTVCHWQDTLYCAIMRAQCPVSIFTEDTGVFCSMPAVNRSVMHFLNALCLNNGKSVSLKSLRNF